MKAIDLDDWIAAGKIASSILKESVSMVKAGEKVINICESIEQKIIKRGAKPAFPVNVSINNIAAHYTSPPRDSLLIPSKALVKIDIGVNLNGALVDTAITVAVGGGKDLVRLIRANKNVLYSAIETIKDGVRVKEISEKIWKISHEFGYGVLVDLGGHEMRKGVLHAGLFIPNHPKAVGRFNKKLKKGMIIAIEPFLTLSNYDSFTDPISDQKYIFSINSRVKEGIVNKDKILRYLYNRFGKLPFALRWIFRSKNVTAREINKLLRILNNLEEKNLLISHPVLVDHNGYWISQFEHTVLVKRGSSVVLSY